VIGAAGAAASSAKTVAAAAVPKTRVATPADAAKGDRAAPVSAPAKSKTPMLVGVAVVVIAAVGGAIMMLKGDGAKGRGRDESAGNEYGAGERRCGEGGGAADRHEDGGWRGHTSD